MLAQRVYYYDPETGTLTVPDTQTASRPRMLALRGEPVLENAEPWIRELVAGRRADEPLVLLSGAQVRKKVGISAECDRPAGSAGEGFQGNLRDLLPDGGRRPERFAVDPGARRHGDDTPSPAMRSAGRQPRPSQGSSCPNGHA